MWRITYLFTTKNYINQFKVRSRLADFFKHIHPDQMAQAPTKIKQQNLRSLKNFNAYLDCINQEKPSQGKLLKFYISQKTNNKSRKFFSFNLELPELTHQKAIMNQQRASKFIDDIVNALNNKFRQSRGILQGKKKEKIILDSNKQEKIQTQQQRMKKMEETIGPFYGNYKTNMAQERLKQAINTKFMQAEKEDLKLKLRQNMVYANTTSNKPMMWSRIVLGESGIYGDYQEILNNLIDPKLIYFSQDIGISQIEQFKKKLLPGELDRLGVRATNAVLQVCEQMQSYSPPICLYVTTHYSATQIPGFFTIPYNFEPAEMLEKFKECCPIILQERERYQQQYDLYLNLKQQLLTKNKIKIADLQFKNNSDINMKLIALKRLAKYQSPQTISLYLLNHEDYKIFLTQYNRASEHTVHLYNRKIFALTNFNQQDMKTTFDGLSLLQTQQK